MSIEALTLSITKAVQYAEQLLMEENMQQFKGFFDEIETTDGLKKLVPKTIAVEMPFTDAVSGTTGFKTWEIPLITITPIHFLMLNQVSVSHISNNNQESINIPFTGHQPAFHDLINDYSGRLAGNQ